MRRRLPKIYSDFFNQKLRQYGSRDYAAELTLAKMHDEQFAELMTMWVDQDMEILIKWFDGLSDDQKTEVTSDEPITSVPLPTLGVTPVTAHDDAEFKVGEDAECI